MPSSKHITVPDTGIHFINSLGGPPLPTGLPTQSLKVLIENRAASQAPLSSYRVAASLAKTPELVSAIR